MEAKPTLSVKNSKTGEKLSYQMDQESILIGRDRGSYIVLDSKRISRNHAEIRFEDGAFFIIDLKSGNGTYLNNQLLEPHEKNLLRSSDKIRIEYYEIIFRANGSSHGDFGDVTDTDILEVKMIKKLLRAVDKENAPILEVASGKQAGKRFILEGKTQEVVIGRDPACEFQIDADVISRKHARIVKKWDTVTIIDLASKNGVYVNDARVNEEVLSDGDRILLGTLALVYRNPAEQEFDFLASQPPPRTETASPSEMEAVESLVRETEEESGGVRVTRRSDTAGEEVPQAATLEAGAEAAVTPPELPQEEAVAPATEGDIPLWHRINLVEIIVGLIGLAILSGSIWLLMKLL